MCIATYSAIRHQTSDFYGPSLPDHEPPSPSPLIMHYINPPPPRPCPHQTLHRKPPPVTPPPPPHYRVLSTPPPPPPRKKGATEKTNPPVWKPIAHLLLTMYVTTSI